MFKPKNFAPAKAGNVLIGNSQNPVWDVVDIRKMSTMAVIPAKPGTPWHGCNYIVAKSGIVITYRVKDTSIQAHNMTLSEFKQYVVTGANVDGLHGEIIDIDDIGKSGALIGLAIRREVLIYGMEDGWPPFTI